MHEYIKIFIVLRLQVSVRAIDVATDVSPAIVSSVGWTKPLPEADEALAGTRCNIDRRAYLSRAEYETLYM
jgi:hypothetical protein